MDKLVPRERQEVWVLWVQLGAGAWPVYQDLLDLQVLLDRLGLKVE